MPVRFWLEAPFINISMIYLIDQKVTDNSHSKYLIDIIRSHTDVSIEVIEINQPINLNDLCKIFLELPNKIKPIDIVLCAWCIPRNKYLDNIINELVEQGCTIVAAAGNFNEPIDNISPANVHGVITVGTLNKMGLVAALSNYSNNKPIIWIPGTNYNVGWKNGSGTSVSAALYCSFLAESRKHNDINLLEKLISAHKTKVFNELNNA